MTTSNVMIPPTHRHLPADFVWGAATSAYQIEGAAADDGRGRVDLGHLLRASPARIVDGGNGDVACDHYHRLRGRPGPDAPAWACGPTASRSRGRACSPTAAARGTRRASTSTTAWSTAARARHRAATSRCTTGTCRRRCRTHGRLGQRATSRCASPTTPSRWPRASATASRRSPRTTSRGCVATLGHEQRHLRARHQGPRRWPRRCRTTCCSRTAWRCRRCARPAPRRRWASCSTRRPPSRPPTARPTARRRASIDGQLVRWYMDPLFLGRYPADVLEILGDDAPVVQDGDMRDHPHAARLPRPQLLHAHHRQHRRRRRAARRGAPSVTDMGWEVYPAGPHRAAGAAARATTRCRRSTSPRTARPTPTTLARTAACTTPRAPTTCAATSARCATRSPPASTCAAISSGACSTTSSGPSGYTKRFGLVHVDYDTQQRTPKDSALLVPRLHRRAGHAPRGRHLHPLNRT